jgi:hypothetical protein
MISFGHYGLSSPRAYDYELRPLYREGDFVVVRNVEAVKTYELTTKYELRSSVSIKSMVNIIDDMNS